ncbi:hypothetical protein [Cyclobacterium amurskyense]|jgi:hypothetical protein|uniref:Uncharacterized protein n=1 Tax=Cyclobacterium amurskyense TaxID=320787 RepID=A0A0H4PIF5_9BACT|nr:hypothetical protein [Cyclobacterium amurskyense]AKP52835.1 hypothetical protein CA2015_3446 [Cyclobacterium amurskyense]|tara:strand:- start:296 stop:523 length:228 start_codon:yes stop_codon:yes gene_type:complete
MEKNNKNNKHDDFQKNSFTEAQNEAEDGKASKKPLKNVEVNDKKDEKAAKDKLYRAKNADKEVTSETDKYRRDNA